MRHVRAEFSTDEVEAVAVSSIDTEQAIFDWIEVSVFDELLAEYSAPKSHLPQQNSLRKIQSQ